METIKKNAKHIGVLLFAIAALVVALSGSEKAEMACNSVAGCKAAYDAGKSADEVSPSAPAVVTPSAPAL